MRKLVKNRREPSATDPIIVANPNAMPAMCGTVRRQPKAAPEAMTIRLFGPGVIEATTAKLSRAR